MMDDIISRTTLGTGGFVATIGLQGINSVVSLLVGVATLTYMVLSIYKIFKKL